MSSAGDELAAARQRIEELEQSLDAAQKELQFFVYAASHDLQQPLRAIGTYSQLLQREYPDDRRAGEFTTVLIDAAGQINGLVTDLLTYSRSGHNVNFSQINLSSPLQTALFKFAKQIAQSEAQVSYVGLPDVFADEQQMVTLFENLIGNSLKFRGPSPPRIEVRSQTGDQFHTIEIQDNGRGIPPKYHEKVFEPFQRLQGREIPGSGLGLSMCRKILGAHGGKIWVESDGSSGTAVKLLLSI